MVIVIHVKSPLTFIFDGDQITVRIVLIKRVAQAMRRLNIKEAALDISKEGKYSHAVNIPQPTIQAWGNYLRAIDQKLN